MSDLTKDEIIAELEARGETVNKRATRDALLEQLANTGEAQEVKTGEVVTKYLKNPKTGRVFESTEALKKMLGTSLVGASEAEYKAQFKD